MYLATLVHVTFSPEGPRTKGDLGLGQLQQGEEGRLDAGAREYVREQVQEDLQEGGDETLGAHGGGDPTQVAVLIYVGAGAPHDVHDAEYEGEDGIVAEAHQPVDFGAQAVYGFARGEIVWDLCRLLEAPQVVVVYGLGVLPDPPRHGRSGLHPPQERAVERDPDDEHVEEGRDEPGKQDGEVVGPVPAHVPEGVPVASLYLACLRMAQHLEQGVFVGVQAGLGQVAARFGHELIEIDG